MSDVSSFWMRRKAAVAAEAEAEVRATEEAAVRAEAQALAGKDDADVLEELGLPDPETLMPGDDFSGFMKQNVPEHLRRLALRRLWRSNPVLACVDGLNEYDDDYRAAMLLQEPIRTAYQVGKGMMAHVEEMQRKAEAAGETPEADSADEAQAVAETGSEPAEQVAFAIEEPVQPDAPSATDLPDGEAVAQANDPMPRRMRFRFEEAGA